MSSLPDVYPEDATISLLAISCSSSPARPDSKATTRVPVPPPSAVLTDTAIQCPASLEFRRSKDGSAGSHSTNSTSMRPSRSTSATGPLIQYWESPNPDGGTYRGTPSATSPLCRKTAGPRPSSADAVVSRSGQPSLSRSTSARSGALVGRPTSPASAVTSANSGGSPGAGVRLRYNRTGTRSPESTVLL